MSNKQPQPQYIIPYLRRFQTENIPRVKISLFDEKSKLEINRIYLPIDSNGSPEKILHHDHNNPNLLSKFLSQQQLTTPIVPHSSNPILNSLASSSKTQAIRNPIDHQEVDIVAYNHKQQLQPSSLKSTSQTEIHSPVIGVEQLLSPPVSQLIPDSIINDKQATNKIFNEENTTHLTHPSKFITLTPKKTVSSITNDSFSSNHVRYYQIGSLFTSTSTFLMHQNRVIAHATASDPLLSDTIFIILIATLTIIILLFCLGLFCLCRRTTKRNISPSFDGSSYVGLNGHSSEIPVNNYQERNSQHENHIPYMTDLPSSSSIQTRLPINQPTLMNDRIPLSEAEALHHTAKQKIPMNNKKLKKKRVGFCCCNSKQTTVNGRTRMRNNEM